MYFSTQEFHDLACSHGKLSKILIPSWNADFVMESWFIIELPHSSFFFISANNRGTKQASAQVG